MTYILTLKRHKSMDELFETITNSIIAYSTSNTINIEYKDFIPYTYSTSCSNATTLIVNLVKEAGTQCNIFTIDKILKDKVIFKDMYGYELKTLVNLMVYYDTLLIPDSVFLSGEKRNQVSLEIQKQLMDGKDERILYFLNISVIEAKGLKAKAKNGMLNNTFVRLFYDGLVYTSQIFKDSLDPRYNLDVSLPVRDVDKIIHLSVWLESEEFLGSCTIDQMDSYSWITLGKRSSRSHVSGQILVSVKNIKPFKDILLQYPILKYIPAKAEILYEQISRSLLAKTYETWNKGIDTDYYRLVSKLEKIWVISKDTRVGILFDEAVEMFARGKLSAVFYHNILHDDVVTQYKNNRYVPGNFRNVSKNLIRFRKLCEARVKGFFNSIEEIKSPDQLKVLPDLMYSIDLALETQVDSQSAFSAKIEGLLEKSVLARFKDLEDKADFKQPITFNRLMKLLDVLTDEVKDLLLNYNFILLDTINVSYLACHLYLRQVVEVLQDFPTIFVSSGMTMSEGFEVYTKSIKFGDLCLSVDSGFRSFLDFSSWFTPLLFEWFKVSEGKMVEWTKNAINIDKFQQSSVFEPSSSFTDVLTFLQQQLDFIFSLEWRDKTAKTLMTEKLYQNIAAVLIKYRQILTDMVNDDFKSFSPAAYKVMKKPNIKKRIKFKIKLKNGKKQVLNPGELRLVPEVIYIF